MQKQPCMQSYGKHTYLACGWSFSGQEPNLLQTIHGKSPVKDAECKRQRIWHKTAEWTGRLCTSPVKTLRQSDVLCHAMLCTSILKEFLIFRDVRRAFDTPNDMLCHARLIDSDQASVRPAVKQKNASCRECCVQRVDKRSSWYSAVETIRVQKCVEI